MRRKLLKLLFWLGVLWAGYYYLPEDAPDWIRIVYPWIAGLLIGFYGHKWLGQIRHSVRSRRKAK